MSRFAVLAQPAVAQGANNTLPLTYPGQVWQGDGSQTCPSERQRERVRTEVVNATLRLLQGSVEHLLQTQLPTQPTTQPPTTQPPTVTRYSCGGSTGWRRVAYLNMSDPSQQCPPVWREYTTPHRVCGRRSPCGSCEGVTYSTGCVQYDQVCGRIIGYQFGNTDAFRGGLEPSIYTYYVEGISVTHGSPRQHIWTFANGLDEVPTTLSYAKCPCITGITTGNDVPSFVGQNYFCETGITRWNGSSGILWPNGDPLWDGQGCGPTSTCCTFNSPPWFNVTLPSPTTDYIEVRICNDHQSAGVRSNDSPVQLIELYVK